MNSDKRYSKIDQHTSGFQNASTPTGNYVINPKRAVCPGRLSRNLSRQGSLGPSIRGHKSETSRMSLRPSKLPIQDSPQSSPPQGVLVVSPTQGVLEIHLKHLDLSQTGYTCIKKRFADRSPAIRMSWKFYSFSRCTIPTLEFSDTHYEIESSVMYKVDLNEEFLDYILTKNLSLELFAKADAQELYLARGELKLTDIFDYPLNELNANVDLCDVDKALVLSNTGIAVVYGTLTLWYRLSCEVNVLNGFISRIGHVYYSPSTDNIADKRYGTSSHRKSSIMALFRRSEQRQQSLGSRRTSLMFHFPDNSSETESSSISANSLEPTDSEIESFKDALDLVLTRNKALRTTQSEISRELSDRAAWLHEESKWKRTLQEYAILSGKNPESVEWRQWRDASTANLKLRDYPSQVVIYKPEVVITIKYLKLYDDSSVVLNDKFAKFYVEYSFLAYDGEDMECPFSISKSKQGEKLKFNFTKTFCIDPETNSEDAQKLADQIRGGESIRFVVVGEPSGTSEIACCEEVGSCKINLLEIIQSESNAVDIALALFDSITNGEDIGYLKVYIEGLLAMRRIALRILAPKEYALLE